MPQATTDFRPKSRTEQRVEHEQGETLPTLLSRLYYDEGLTQGQIAERLGVRLATVSAWMRQFRMPTRDRRATKVA